MDLIEEFLVVGEAKDEDDRLTRQYTTQWVEFEKLA